MRAYVVGVVVWLLAAAAGALPVVEIGTNFTGPTLGVSGYIPPDSQGAVGEEHIATFVNGRYRIYRKSDGQLLESTTLDQFWLDAGVVPIDNSFDPRVLYDPDAQRWYAISADGGPEPNRFLLAVSQSADPTGPWSGFAIDSDSTDQNWADFPMIGYDADALYLSAPMFPVSGVDAPTGATFVVIPKADLLAATPTVANATSFQRVTLAKAGFQPQPVVDLDGGGLPGKFYSGTLTFLGQIQVSRINGPLTAPTYTGGGLIAVDALPEPPDADQPGPQQNLDAGDSRFGSSIVRRNGVDWAVQTVDVDGRAAVRWIQIDPDLNIVLDWGVIADPGLDLIYPSIAVNEFDQIVIGMSGSGESQFPSAYAVVGELVGGVTSFGDLLLLAAGQGSYQIIGSGNRNRWGDYSATVVDPSNPHSFWTFQEFAVGTNSWGVRVTQLLLVPEPGTATLLILGITLLARRRRRTHTIARAPRVAVAGGRVR